MPFLSIFCHNGELVSGRNLLPSLPAEIPICNKLPAFLIEKFPEIPSNEFLWGISQKAAEFIIGIHETVRIVNDENAPMRMFHNRTEQLF